MKEKTNSNPLMTPRELAQYLKVSNAWVRDHTSGRRKPVLPHVWLGDRRGLPRYWRDQIDAFLQTYTRNAVK